MSLGQYKNFKSRCKHYRKPPCCCFSAG